MLREYRLFKSLVRQLQHLLHRWEMLALRAVSCTSVRPIRTLPTPSACNRELKQTRRRRQRERHLKMKLQVSAIISQLFKVTMLEKCFLTVLE